MILTWNEWQALESRKQGKLSFLEIVYKYRLTLNVHEKSFFMVICLII